jgi:hypothetical protein
MEGCRDTFSRDCAGSMMEPLVKFNEKLELQNQGGEREPISCGPADKDFGETYPVHD